MTQAIRAFWNENNPHPIQYIYNHLTQWPNPNYSIKFWMVPLKKIQSNCLHCWCQPGQISRFMGPIWDPPGSCGPQVGPMLAPWTLLSGWSVLVSWCQICHHRQQWRLKENNSLVALPLICWVHLITHLKQHEICHDIIKECSMCV